MSVSLAQETSWFPLWFSLDCLKEGTRRGTALVYMSLVDVVSVSLFRQLGATLAQAALGHTSVLEIDRGAAAGAGLHRAIGKAATPIAQAKAQATQRRSLDDQTPRRSMPLVQELSSNNDGDVWRGCVLRGTSVLTVPRSQGTVAERPENGLETIVHVATCGSEAT